MKKFCSVIVFLALICNGVFARDFHRIQRNFFQYKTKVEYIPIDSDYASRVNVFLHSFEDKLYEFDGSYICKNLPKEVRDFTCYMIKDNWWFTFDGFKSSGITFCPSPGFVNKIIVITDCHSDYPTNKWLPYGCNRNLVGDKANGEAEVIISNLQLTDADAILIHEYAHAYQWYWKTYGYQTNKSSPRPNGGLGHGDDWKASVRVVIESMHETFDDNEELMEILIEDIIRKYK